MQPPKAATVTFTPSGEKWVELFLKADAISQNLAHFHVAGTLADYI